MNIVRIISLATSGVRSSSFGINFEEKIQKILYSNTEHVRIKAIV